MDRILTLHPNPSKSGVNIDGEKYEAVRRAILGALRAHGTLTFTALVGRLEQELSAGFAGSIPWYVTTIKLDLEARGLIERIPGRRPQQIRLVVGSNTE